MAGTATGTDRGQFPTFGGGSGFTPLAKSRRPEGMPEAGPALAPYRPPPIEDDDIEGGMDDLGMAPETVGNLEEEVKDLNADLLTID